MDTASQNKAIRFYSDFFKKQSFLTYSSDLFYSREEYLKSQGFHKGLDFSGKVVLELGAGTGRLTLSLFKMGLIGKAKKYIVVEPSNGLDTIKRELNGKLKNIVYVKNTLQELSSHMPAKSVDYFIAAGVLPHINSGLTEILDSIKKFINENGTLHIVSSYYGFEKKIAIEINRRTVAYPIAGIRALSMLNALFQTFVFYLPVIPALQKHYLRNFIYSPQNKLLKKYRQFEEFYSVHPYNINWGYEEYISCLEGMGFGLLELLPYSLALKFRLDADGKTVSQHTTFFEQARDGVALLGKDCFSDLVAEELGKAGIAIKQRLDLKEIAENRPHVPVVLGHNYYELPYHTAVAALESLGGYQFGKDIFLFQMFI